jgi:hypothetical protein
VAVALEHKKNALNLFFLFGSLGFSFSSISSLFLYQRSLFPCISDPVLFISPPSFCPFSSMAFGLLAHYVLLYNWLYGSDFPALLCSALFCSALLYSAVLQRLFANKGLLTFLHQKKKKSGTKDTFSLFLFLFL